MSIAYFPPTLLSLEGAVCLPPPRGGGADDTDNINTQLNLLAGNGGNVYCRPATYTLAGGAGSILIPDSACLVGTGLGPSTGVGLRGTVFSITGGAGFAAGQTIGLNNSSGINGITFYYPNQPITNSVPISYPYTVGTVLQSTGGVAINPYIINCCFYNPYQAISIVNGARATIENVFGSPIAMGVNTDGSEDINRYRNIHWNPFYGVYQTALGYWIGNNMIAFQFGRSDSQECSALFAFSCAVGYRFFTGTGSIPGTTYGTFRGCTVEAANIGIDCQATNPISGIDWMGGGIAASGAPPIQVQMGGGILTMNGVRFYNPGQFNQTSGNLQLNGCTFSGATAFSASSGTFGMNGSQIINTSTSVSLTGTAKATLVGNTGPGSTAFASLITTNTTTGNVVNSGNN